MFKPSKINLALPPGSPLRIRTMDAANPGQWDVNQGDVEVSLLWLYIGRHYAAGQRRAASSSALLVVLR